MKSLLPLLAAISAIGMTVAAAPAATAAKSAGPTDAALAAAGRSATLQAIDYGEDHCDGAMTVGAWLKALVGTRARAIRWTGGECELVNDHPGIDAASWPYCAQATISLVHPKAKEDSPEIEIYLNKPVHGRPGSAYAFRSIMMTRDDGPDYERARQDFESEWNERFPPTGKTVRCEDP